METEGVDAVTDEQIMDLYWQRNESAIHETNVKYGSYCYAIAENILNSHEDSEESVNDTWLHAWNTMPPQRPNQLKLFLAKITRNLSFNKFKAKTADKRGGGEIAVVLDELGECLADKTDVESTYFENELAQSINQFVRTLPLREGDVFVRRYFFTEPIAVIAARYGMKENHVMVTLSRTRQKLKRHLIKEGYI